MIDRKYMNLEQLKEFLGVNHQTVYNFRRLWGLPYIKIGSTVRYDRDEVERWMAGYRCVDSQEEPQQALAMSK